MEIAGEASTRRPLRRRRGFPFAALAATVACSTLACSLLALSAEAAEEPRVLRVATSGDYAPFSIATPASRAANTAAVDSPPVGADKLSGFDIALAAEFAADRGYRIAFTRFRWPDLGRELAARSFDIAMSGVTMRTERSIAGRFSVPVAATRAIALTWKGSGATSLENLDLASRRIAVNAGGHLEAVARRIFRRADVVAIADNEAVRMALLDRAYDAVVTDDFEEKVWTKGVKDVVRIGPLSDDRKAYLLPDDRGGVAAELDRWLLASEKDGTLASLRSKFFGDVGRTATATPLDALAVAIAERTSIMPHVYEAKRGIRKPIEDKEQEAAVLESALESTREAASAAAAEPPDAAQSRLFFKALMEMGKQVQQRLADEESVKRQAMALERIEVRRAVRAAGGSTGEAAGEPGDVDEEAQQTPPEPAAVEPPEPAAVEPPEPSVVEPRGPRYDLATQLRPAIGRITEKIARLLVALDEPVSAQDARRRIAAALTGQGVDSGQIDVVATTIEKISKANAER